MAPFELYTVSRRFAHAAGQHESPAGEIERELSGRAHPAHKIVRLRREAYVHEIDVRRQLLERLRGGADYREPRTIDVHVRHLREKIEREPREPELILTVRGAGYRFRDS